MHSVGDMSAARRDEWEPPLTFYYFTHHTEFPRWMAVPVKTAREALRRFVATGGTLPDNVRWEED